jgi:hypothetical protein
MYGTEMIPYSPMSVTSRYENSYGVEVKDRLEESATRLAEIKEQCLTDIMGPYDLRLGALRAKDPLFLQMPNFPDCVLNSVRYKQKTN